MIRRVVMFALVLVAATSLGVGLVAKADPVPSLPLDSPALPPTPDQSPTVVPQRQTTEPSLGPPLPVPNRDRTSTQAEGLDAPTWNPGADQDPSLPGPPQNVRVPKTQEEISRIEKFMQAARTFANVSNAAEVERMTEKLQKKTVEESARQRVSEVERMIDEIIRTFPETEGAKRAQRMRQAGAPAPQLQPATDDDPF